MTRKNKTREMIKIDEEPLNDSWLHSSRDGRGEESGGEDTSPIDKAAMAGAASGTPGYVPMPEAYDGALKPIKTKKKDRELEDKSKKLFDELADEIQAQVDRYFEEI